MKRFEWDQKETLLKKFDEETKEWMNIELGKKKDYSEKVEQKFKNKHLTMIDIDLFCEHHEKDRLEMVKEPYKYGRYHCNICDYRKEIGEFTEVYLCPKCREERRHINDIRKMTMKLVLIFVINANRETSISKSDKRRKWIR